MDTVLFVCTHNSSRSQMAEGLLRDRYGDRYEVHSAGTNPGRVNPFAVEVMAESGIDISGHAAEHVDTYTGGRLDTVVTVCDDAAENCPYIPAEKQNLHRGFEDPSAVTGTDDEKRAAFRRVRDELADWIDATFGPDGTLSMKDPMEDSRMIQPATAEDLETIRQLLRIVELPHDDLTPAHLSHFLVARDGGDVLGTVGLEPVGDGALLRSLAVAPAHRDEGIGGRLVDAIERRARQWEVQTLYLLTTTAADYFRRRGYQTMDRDALPEAVQQTEEAAQLCPASATCMWKDLSTGEDRLPGAE